MKGVLGQGEALGATLRAARDRRLHHAVLITGSRGTGKSLIASAIAAAVLCESAGEDGGCGDCAACRKVERRSHADLHFLAPLEDKQDISVDQVRELQVTLRRQPAEGRARVAVIDPADQLNEHGQNALLKTLEEPGSHTHLVLTTARPERLLETVRSRAHRLRALPLPAAMVASALESANIGDFEARELAARASAGSLGLAQDLVAEGVGGLHQQLVGFLGRPDDISPIACARGLLEGAEDRQANLRRLRLVLAYLRGLVRDSMVASLARPEARSYFPDVFPSWVAVIHSLFQAEQDLDLRIGPEQVLTATLSRLAEEWPRTGVVDHC